MSRYGARPAGPCCAGRLAFRCHDGRMLPTPRALLLDFGGVIVDGPTSPTWAADAASVVAEALVADDRAADASWLVDAPTQHGSEAFWGDVVAATWPAAARRVVVAHATGLSRRLAELKFVRNWQSRPGIADLLAAAAAPGLPMAVVSNTICGAAHRDFLASAGLAGHFVVQLYTDEQRVRKPNPELVWRATAALGVSPADCWFVGDTLSRDVLAARRAGCGAAVLMRSGRVERPPYPDAAPDAVVADPDHLRALLSRLF